MPRVLVSLVLVFVLALAAAAGSAALAVAQAEAAASADTRSETTRAAASQRREARRKRARRGKAGSRRRARCRTARRARCRKARRAPAPSAPRTAAPATLPALPLPTTTTTTAAAPAIETTVQPTAQTAAAAPPAPYFGFNDMSVIAGEATVSQDTRLTTDAGASSTRLEVDWSWVERTRGSLKLGLYDPVYKALTAAGVRPLLHVTGSPAWARDADVACASQPVCHTPPAAAYLEDWRRFVAAVVARYPLAAGIEVWNEPNETHFWRTGADPARYAELLKISHAAVKSVDPAMPVIAGALAPNLKSETTADSMPMRKFLNGMYRAGAKGHLDGISVHPYAFDVDYWRTFKAMSVVAEARDIHGDRAPLWITELGLSSTDGRWSEDVQAMVLTSLWERLRSNPEVAGVWVHRLVEDGDRPAADVNRGYGTVRPDLAPKPVYCLLAEAQGSSYACPEHVSRPVASRDQRHRWEAQVLLQAAADAALVHHRSAGTYRTLSSVILNRIDARLSGVPLVGDALPGAGADPSMIGVYPSADGADGVLLCNASTADRTYCLFVRRGRDWAYGSTTGSLYATAGATTKGASASW